VPSKRIVLKKNKIGGRIYSKQQQNSLKYFPFRINETNALPVSQQ
jgi:hypothetical protein